jgi:hypothetical protein
VRMASTFDYGVIFVFLLIVYALTSWFVVLVARLWDEASQHPITNHTIPHRALPLSALCPHALSPASVGLSRVSRMSTRTVRL